MRHFLPLTILAVAVAGGLALAVNAHHDYIHQLTVQNAKAAAAHAKVAIKKQYLVLTSDKKLQVANTDIVLLRAQCMEGEAAYNLLTPLQKQQNQQVRAPYCNYSTVQ
jgi:hypothetical protein